MLLENIAENLIAIGIDSVWSCFPEIIVEDGSRLDLLSEKIIE